MTPKSDLRLVDIETKIIRRRQARCCADDAVDIRDVTTLAADHMVMIVIDSVFETGWRTNRLDTSHEAFFNEQLQ